MLKRHLTLSDMGHVLMWETDLLPLLVLTRRGRSTGNKNQYTPNNFPEKIPENFQKLLSVLVLNFRDVSALQHSATGSGNFSVFDDGLFSRTFLKRSHLPLRRNREAVYSGSRMAHREVNGL